jgi:hypothetical protein
VLVGAAVKAFPFAVAPVVAAVPFVAKDLPSSITVPQALLLPLQLLAQVWHSIPPSRLTSLHTHLLLLAQSEKSNGSHQLACCRK